MARYYFVSGAFSPQHAYFRQPQFGNGLRRLDYFTMCQSKYHDIYRRGADDADATSAARDSRRLDCRTIAERFEDGGA